MMRLYDLIPKIGSDFKTDAVTPKINGMITTNQTVINSAGELGRSSDFICDLSRERNRSAPLQARGDASDLLARSAGCTAIQG